MSICLYNGKLIKDGEEIGDKSQVEATCITITDAHLKFAQQMKTAIRRLINEKITLYKDGEEIGDKRQCSSNCKKRGYDKMLQSAKENIKKMNALDRALSGERNRKYKLETLLTELNSLSRRIDVGCVKCGECGSTKIVYTSCNSMISSIKDSIKLKNEIIDELKRDLALIFFEL